MIRSKALRRFVGMALLVAMVGTMVGCGAGGGPSGGSFQAEVFVPKDVEPTVADQLTTDEIGLIIRQGVAEAQRIGQTVVIAVTDRDGRVRGVFRMAGAPAGAAFPGTLPTCLPFPGFEPCAAFGPGVNCAIAKARTASFFQSTGEAFTTRTALFIIQSHFPPGILNAAGGPLYGVNNSSLPGSDVLPLANGIQPNGIAGTFGGIPLYKNGFPVGGVGVSGATEQVITTDDPVSARAITFNPDTNEQIALGAQRGFAPNPLIQADQVLVDNIRFPYVASPIPPAVTPPALADLGGAVPGTFDFPITAFVPLTYPPDPVLGTTAGGFPGEFRYPVIDSPLADPDKLLASDVRTIIEQAVNTARQIRGQIRRPEGTNARVWVSVVDTAGTILGVFRMRDATLFSFDVAVQKARTAAFFSSDAVLAQPETANFKALLGVPNTQQIAISTRAIGFLAQNFYPPGINGNPAGPLFGLQSCFGLRPSGNGITVFPGGVPLYKNGKLAGGIGVSGDGVDQDDAIADAGSTQYFPPLGVLKSDQLFFNGARLPYIKLPRNPTGGVTQ